MEYFSYFKNKLDSFLKKKSSKIILFLTAIFILASCLYFMTSDKGKLIMAVSMNGSYGQDGTVQLEMLDAKNKSMVTLKQKINCFDSVNYGGTAFSPDNKMIAHEKNINADIAPSIYIYDIDKNKDILLASPPPSDSTTANYILYLSWLDNNNLLYLSASRNSLSRTFSMNNINFCYTLNSENINTKKITSIPLKGIRLNKYISYMTYLADYNKIYLCIQDSVFDSTEEPNYTEKVYECSPDLKNRALLFTFKDSSIKKIAAVPGTSLILFSANKSLGELSGFPTIINMYDHKTKKLEKLYETPSPYPNAVDFISYSKHNVLLQYLRDYEKKYYDLDIKTGKCTEVDFSNRPLSTEFIAFSCK